MSDEREEVDADAAWAPPTGPAAADPDATDDAETVSDALPPPAPHAVASAPPVPPAPTQPPSAVTPLAGDAPVAGRPWTVRATTAAGVSALAIEIEGRAENVAMHLDPQHGPPPRWSATIDGVGADPLRYRFVWRSSWSGDVTGWHTATPSTT